jgi:tetratricopeptide (TPR) repeat protein
MSVRVLAISSLLAILVAPPASAQDDAQLVGRKVMTVNWKTEFRSGKKVLETVDLGQVYTVDAVKGSWLKLTGKRGWIDRKNVVPAEEATAYFSEKIKRFPTAPNHHHRGLAALALGDVEAALGDFNQAIRLKPSEAVYYNSRGNARILQVDLDQAIADYSQAIRLDPKFAAAYFNRGIAWNAAGQHDKAIQNMNQAIELAPKNSFFYYGRGMAWKARPDLDQAIRDFTQAIRFNPHHADALMERAMAWQNQGQYARAIGDFQEVIRLNPDSTQALNNLAWLLATCPDDSVRDGQRSVEYATKACELSDWSAATGVDTLAAGYAASGDFEQAQKWAQRAIDLAEGGEKEVFSTRLELYKAGKPYIEHPPGRS